MAGGDELAETAGRLEREAKLEAAPEFQLPPRVVDGLRLGASWDEQLDTAYFDTSELRLLRHDVTLRRRLGEGWTIKLPESARGQALIRREHVFAGDTDDVPAGALDLVQAIVRREPLTCVVRLQTIRHHVPLHDASGRRLGEIVDDAVTVLDQGRSFREVEVELAQDAEDGVLDTVVSVLIDGGAIAGTPKSKLLRALGPRAAEVSDHSLAGKRSRSIGELIRSALSASVAGLLWHDPGVRLGGDPEHVHQARVATRRLRSTLQTFRAYLEPGWAGGLRSELTWLGGALGQVRDAEVLHDRLIGRVDHLPTEDREAATALIHRLAEEHDDKRAELLIVLRSERYLDLLEALEAGAAQPRLTSAAEHEALGSLNDLVRLRWRQLAKAVSRLGDTPADAELHAVRIRAKRCRYAAEAVAPLHGKRCARFISACQGLQDVLGEHQDCVVARAWLRHNATNASSREAFAAGQMSQLECDAAATANAAWPDAWAALNKPRLRHWLTA